MTDVERGNEGKKNEMNERKRKITNNNDKNY